MTFAKKRAACTRESELATANWEKRHPGISADDHAAGVAALEHEHQTAIGDVARLERDKQTAVVQEHTTRWERGYAAAKHGPLQTLTERELAVREQPMTIYPHALQRRVRAWVRFGQEPRGCEARPIHAARSRDRVPRARPDLPVLDASMYVKS